MSDKKVPPPVCQVEYKQHPTEKMLACQYMGPKNMQINSVPKPMITVPKDCIVRITHCTICGSDLHMYVGEMDSAMKKGDIMGHEAIGFVEEVGPEVKKIKKGDRVIILPVICCGECFYCKKQEYSLCDRTNPVPEMDKMWGHRLSGIFGYTQLTGGYPGDQAEYCRVPNADLVCVQAPKEGISADKLLALADIATTAWHGCELAEVGKGHTVAVWGCGPIGLSIQKLSFFRGASKVYAIDPDPKRLKIAESFGAIPVNVTEHKDVADYLLEQEPHGLDKTIEASGFRSAQSWVHKTMRTLDLEGDQSDTIAAAIKACRKGGNLALIGDFFFNTNEFPIGALMEKTITLRGGQLFAQKYHPYLLNITVEGDYDPSFVFTHRDKFENLPSLYKMQNEHTMPGGLKAVAVTAYGRELEGSS